MEKRSFLKELLYRKVPQFVGLYIAAMWMTIEIGDWVIERFQFSQNLTSYVFIIFLTLLPSVIYIAYQHGLPGRNPWHKRDFFLFPTNLVILLVIIANIESGETITFQLKDVKTYTETTEKTGNKHGLQSVIFHDGTAQTSQESAANNLRRVVLHNWSSDKLEQNSEWLLHILPSMFSKQLNSYPFISASSAFADKNVALELQNAGFKNGLNVPRALEWEIARKKHADYSVHGQLSGSSSSGYTASIDLVPLQTPSKIEKLTIHASSIFELVDISITKIEKALSLNESQLEEPRLPMGERYSRNIEAIKRYTHAIFAINYQNNFDSALEELNQAINLDPSFASAYLMLGGIQVSKGKPQEALEFFSKAKKHDYRLSTSEKFNTNSQIYFLRGDGESQKKTLVTWLDVQPNSTQAHWALVKYYRNLGNSSALVIDHLQSILAIDPSRTSVYKQISQHYAQLGQLSKAIETITAYLDSEPNDASAQLLLAQLYVNNQQRAEAIKIYEKLYYQQDSSVAALINLLKLTMESGDFDNFDKLYNGQDLNSFSNLEQLQLKTMLSAYYALKGQISKALEINQANTIQAEAIMPPLQVMLSFKLYEVMYYMGAQNFDKALESVDYHISVLQKPFNLLYSLTKASITVAQKDIDSSKQMIAKIESELSTNNVLPNIEPMANLLKAEVHLLQNNPVQAIELINNVIEQTKDTVLANMPEFEFQLRTALAKAYRINGNYEKANQQLNSVLTRYPVMPNANLELIDLKIDLEDWETARSTAGMLSEIWKNADANFEGLVRLQKQIETIKTNTTNKLTHKI